MKLFIWRDPQREGFTDGIALAIAEDVDDARTKILDSIPGDSDYRVQDVHEQIKVKPTHIIETSNPDFGLYFTNRTH